MKITVRGWRVEVRRGNWHRPRYTAYQGDRWLYLPWLTIRWARVIMIPREVLDRMRRQADGEMK